MRIQHLIALVALAASTATHGAGPIPDTVFVVGNAVVAVEPQFCAITARLKQEGEEYPRIYSALQARSAAAFSHAKDLGIEDADIDGSNLERNTQRPENSRQRTELIRTIRATVRNLQNCSKLLDKLMVMPGVERLDLEFSVNNIAEHEQAALQKAISDAKGQAELLAKSFGRKLGKALSISQTRFSSIAARFGGTESPYDSDSRPPSFVPPPEGPAFRVPKYVKFEGRVYVLFRIEP